MIKAKLWQHKEGNKMEKAIKKKGKMGIKGLGKMLLGVAIGLICTNMAGIETYAAWDTRSGVTALSNLGSGGSNKVWFGSGSNGNGTPIYWRVLDRTANDGSTKALFMLTEYSQGKMAFNSSSGNSWSASSIKTWLQGTYYNSKFTEREQNAIVGITKSESGTPSWNSYASPCGLSVSGEKIFLLSGLEVGNSTYGLTSASSRICRTSSSDSTAVWWWLRSASSSDNHSAASVYTDGSGDYIYSDNTNGAVRCALNINLTSVIFTSPASNASGTSNLKSIPSSTSEARKLTLKDSSKNSFTAYPSSISQKAGKNILIKYSGATTTSSKDYISVLIFNSGKTTVYYGTVKAVGTSSGSGFATITIPSGLATGTYTLRVLDEEKNAANYTNYAWYSDISLTVTATERDAEPPRVTNVYTNEDNTYYKLTANDSNGLYAITNLSGTSILKDITSLGTSGTVNVGPISATTELGVHGGSGARIVKESNMHITPDTNPPVIDDISYDNGEYVITVTDADSGIWKIVGNKAGQDDVLFEDYST